MHLLSILALMVGGAIGVWYGFVDDIELAFLAGILAWATATVGVFRGNFNQPDDLPADARLNVRTGAIAVGIVALLVIGAGAAWVAFVDDVKPAMLLALLAWGTATFVAFSGNGGIAEPGAPEGSGGVSTQSAGTTGLVLLILGGMTAGALGLWYGFVEDQELGFAAGVFLFAGATFITFRGKITSS
jgi:hypothetical protein